MDDTTTRPAPNADTEDPRGKDVGQGYPEENQPGTSPGGPPGPGHPDHDAERGDDAGRTGV
jgi:hypothetical protein